MCWSSLTIRNKVVSIIKSDKENIKKVCLSLKNTTGEISAGVYFGRVTPNTRALFLVAFQGMGAQLLYSSEAHNDDVLYWQDIPTEKDLPDTEKKGMLIVPYNHDCNGTSLYPYH